MPPSGWLLFPHSCLTIKNVICHPPKGRLGWNLVVGWCPEFFSHPGLHERVAFYVTCQSLEDQIGMSAKTAYNTSHPWPMWGETTSRQRSKWDLCLSMCVCVWPAHTMWNQGLTSPLLATFNLLWHSGKWAVSVIGQTLAGWNTQTPKK